MPKQPEDELTWTDALKQAVRILGNAEVETNLAMSETITRIAEAWIAVAGLLRD